LGKGENPEQFEKLCDISMDFLGNLMQMPGCEVIMTTESGAKSTGSWRSTIPFLLLPNYSVF